MELTLDKIQLFLVDLSALFQFCLAVLGVITVLYPLIQSWTSVHDDSTYLLPASVTTFLHQAFQLLGIPQLMMYIRPQAYYDDLAKRLAGNFFLAH
jgi:hypothetical protein